LFVEVEFVVDEFVEFNDAFVVVQAKVFDHDFVFLLRQF
jgi:hypothetical protein